MKVEETTGEDAELPVFSTVVEPGEVIGVVRAFGEVDLGSVPLLKAALAEASEAEDGVILDMAGVTYMDSSGFAALLEAARILRSTGASLHLIQCSAGIARMMAVTRLSTVFDLHDTEEQARRAIGTEEPA